MMKMFRGPLQRRPGTGALCPKACTGFRDCNRSPSPRGHSELVPRPSEADHRRVIFDGADSGVLLSTARQQDHHRTVIFDGTRVRSRDRQGANAKVGTTLTQKRKHQPCCSGSSLILPKHQRERARHFAIPEPGLCFTSGEMSSRPKSERPVLPDRESSSRRTRFGLSNTSRADDCAAVTLSLELEMGVPHQQVARPDHPRLLFPSCRLGGTIRIQRICRRRVAEMEPIAGNLCPEAEATRCILKAAVEFAIACRTGRPMTSTTSEFVCGDLSAQRIHHSVIAFSQHPVS